MSPPISLAFLIDSFEPGGTELNAVRTAESLVTHGLSPSIYHLQPDGPLKQRYEALGLAMQHVPIQTFRSPGTWMSIRNLGSMLKARGMTILHCHDIYTNIVGAAALFGRTGTRLITSRRWWKVSPRRGMGTLNRLAHRASDLVLANSARVGQLVIAENPSVGQRVVVVPNFLERGAYEPMTASEITAWRTRIGLLPDLPTIGIVARLAPVKNHQLLLHAFDLVTRRSPAVQLAIVGEGQEESLLRRLQASLACADRIHFVGALPSRPSPHLLFDISVLCSTSEGFPNSVIEAMAAGRPVVATDVGGVRDAVRDGETGMVVPPGIPHALADSIGCLLDDPALASRMGTRGNAVARECFSDSTVLPGLLSLYRGLSA